VRRNIKEFTKQALVQKLLENELKDKIKIDPSDVEMYYKANKYKYTEEATAKVSVIKFQDQQKAQDTMRRLEVGADFVKMVKGLSEDEGTKAKDGAIESPLSKDGYIPGIGTSKEAADLIFSKKEGQIVGPVKINDAYYIFNINSIKPQVEKPFEEVKEQVEYEYKNKKVQEQMQILLKDVMQEQEVEIFPDKILKKEQQSPENKPENKDEAKNKTN
jgi:peptidyl-prolyl cis-trans isomerase D